MNSRGLRIPAEPVVVSLQEGAVANLSVVRTGRADSVATVMYHVEYGAASPGDFTLLRNETLLVFYVGEWVKNISVALEDDDIPETDEPFYLLLSNASGESSTELALICDIMLNLLKCHVKDITNAASVHRRCSRLWGSQSYCCD